MLNELITKEDAKEAYCKNFCHKGVFCPDGGRCKEVEDAFNTIQSIDSIRTGRWNFIGDMMHECTECGVAYTEYQFEKIRVHVGDPLFPKFCPSCGADMRGK